MRRPQRPQRIEIATCGHYPQYTHPESMARIIAAFLKSEEPPLLVSRPYDLASRVTRTG